MRPDFSILLIDREQGIGSAEACMRPEHSIERSGLGRHSGRVPASFKLQAHEAYYLLLYHDRKRILPYTSCSLLHCFSKDAAGSPRTGSPHSPSSRESCCSLLQDGDEFVVDFSCDDYTLSGEARWSVVVETAKDAAPRRKLQVAGF